MGIWSLRAKPNELRTMYLNKFCTTMQAMLHGMDCLIKIDELSLAALLTHTKQLAIKYTFYYTGFHLLW